MDTTHQLFSLLRFSLCPEAPMPVIGEEEWDTVFRLARKQAIQGVVLQGVARMPLGTAPPHTLLMRWIAEGRAIERRNKQLDNAVDVVVKWFAKRGFRTCLLKGQGNALMYPEPSSRCPGDIDIWVEGDDDEIIDLIRSVNPDVVARYHHVECPPYGDVEIEAHYRPGFMFNPLHNSRLQAFFLENRTAQMSNIKNTGRAMVALPTTRFNIVYQLSHIHNHLFDRGIGLRQLTDYYLLLSRASTEDMPNEVLLRRLGLWKMAGAVMYVMKVIYALDDKLMIASPDARRGRLMLAEILAGGNFGQHDRRFAFRDGRMWRNIQRLWRDIRLVIYFPSPCICEPPFRLFHFFWRLRHS